MLRVLVLSLVTPVLAVILSVYYGIIIYFKLLKDNLLRRTKKCVNRDYAPKCLKDPKYGTHKYRYINVSQFLFRVNLCSSLLDCNTLSRFILRRKCDCITSKMVIRRRL